jgi:hypothetical protein
MYSSDDQHRKSENNEDLKSDITDESESNEPAFLWEFKANLAQQAFGIARHRIIGSTPTNAIAEVVLADDQICTIELSSRGYKVRFRILCVLL